MNCEYEQWSDTTESIMTDKQMHTDAYVRIETLAEYKYWDH